MITTKALALVSWASPYFSCAPPIRSTPLGKIRAGSRDYSDTLLWRFTWLCWGADLPTWSSLVSSGKSYTCSNANTTVLNKVFYMIDNTCRVEWLVWISHCFLMQHFFIPFPPNVSLSLQNRHSTVIILQTPVTFATSWLLPTNCKVRLLGIYGIAGRMFVPSMHSLCSCPDTLAKVILNTAWLITEYSVPLGGRACSCSVCLW